MKLIRIPKTAANVKEVIHKYKLDDPFLLFFLTKYEPLIPWAKVKSAEDINSYIKSTLLPELKNKIDPKSSENNYIKDIDMEQEFLRNPADPQLQEQRDPYIKDPEGTKNRRLEHLNSIKKNRFDKWWNSITKDEAYSSSPAFMYSVLQPIINMYPDNDKRAILFKDEALNDIYEKIRDEAAWKQPFKIDKAYVKKLEEINAIENKQAGGFEADPKNPQNGWLRLPSKTNETVPGRWEENVKKLMEYSVEPGWCTAQDYNAKPYLTEGDFWLYLVDGSAKVAIKLLDPDNKIDQIRGKNNYSPKEYWEPIVDLFEKKNLDQTSMEYQTATKGKYVNEDFNAKPEFRQQVIKEASEGKFNNVDLLTNENKNRDDLKEAIAKGWVIKLGRTYYSDSDSLESVPKEFLSYPEVFEKLKGKWLMLLETHPVKAFKSKIPRAIKRTPEFQVSLAEAVMEALTHGGMSEDVLKNLPQNWRKNKGMVDAIKSGWVKGFERRPVKQEKILQSDIEISNEFKNDPDVLAARRKGWMETLSRSLASYDEYFPADLKDLTDEKNADIKRALRDGYAATLKNNPLNPAIRLKADELFPDDKEIQDAVRSGILKNIQIAYKPSAGYPNYGKYAPILGIPEEMKNDPEILTMQKGIIMSIFDKKPFEAFFKTGTEEINEEYFPKTLQADPDILKARKAGIMKGVLKDPKLWDVNKAAITALGLIEDPDIIKNTKRGWSNLIQKNPISTEKMINEAEPGSFITLYMQDNAAIQEAQKKALISYIVANEDSIFQDRFVNYIHKFSDKVRGMDEVIRSYKKTVAKHLLSQPWEISNKNFPQALMKSQYIQKAVHQGLLGTLGRWTINPTNYVISPDFQQRLALIPKEILASRDIIVAYKQALAALVQRNPWVSDDPTFPKKLLADPLIQDSLTSQKEQLANTYMASLQKGDMSKGDITNDINTNDRIPSFMKSNLLEWLAGIPDPQQLQASKKCWYLDAQMNELENMAGRSKEKLEQYNISKISRDIRGE